MADLEKVIRQIPKRKVEKALGRTERMNLLVTPQQKGEIREAAERYGLSMTDYLLRLHEMVNSQAQRQRRR